MDWLRQPAESAEIQYRRRLNTFYGVGVPEDKAEAAKWYHKAAKQEYVSV